MFSTHSLATLQSTILSSQSSLQPALGAGVESVFTKSTLQYDILPLCCHITLCHHDTVLRMHTRVSSVTSVLPKGNRLRETRKWAQPTGCPLSHWSPRKLRTSYGVLQLIFKLREVSSHENWYIYIVRKSRDRWLCTQSQS